MKLYYPPHHNNPSYRGQVFPLLKPFIKKEGFTDTERIKIYGVSDEDFIIVNSMDACEVVILPMSWYYYKLTNKMGLAFKCIEEANVLGKMVWSINNGDFGVKLPSFKNLIVFRQGGYVSNDQVGHIGYPSFINDYLIENKLIDTYLNTNFNKQPIVGFCGQAQLSNWSATKEMAKQIVRNLRSLIGLSFLEPQKIISASYLRASILKQLEINPAIDSHFIKRKKYRAGVTQNKEEHSTTADFYNNILESQYVLCIRGAGNFSVRFYETLMMGRIPLYIDTDGYLPLIDNVKWKEHVVWVDYKDRHRAAEILLDFHQKLDQDSLGALLKKNRKLWEEKLTLSGFFNVHKEITEK
ncbi:glycosyltransferase family 47 protein [Psychroserpens damuponensis]|uniref:hypothetical protein n=1 Tax=Psychroserpens damuponensis TaxID=943936 RepID=UPI0013792931|nr:hypothetical protein [Psychroserpens damuponensis]